jgi:outer membrane protein OmpA-like peptidoglycan-associated protein
MRFMKTKNLIIVVLFLMTNLLLILTSCSNWNRAEKGMAIGAGAGAGAGAAIGSQSNHTLEGAIIGAAIGGISGAAIGGYMDKQAEELRNDLKNAKVERVGEGIKITFDSGILFAIDSYDLNEASKSNLSELSKTLQKYDDTNILIEGHTDNTGTKEHNLTLSEQRAKSVATYLKSYGVSGSRIATNGYGESQPVADNTTTEGKSKNRRVDVAIFANKKLKKAAENGELSSK